MKKILSMLLVVVITASIAIGGTVAFLTQELDEKTNMFTVGNINVDLDEETAVIGEGGKAEKTYGDDNEVTGTKYTNVMPGDFLKKEVTVENKGLNDAYVAVTVTLNNADKINNALDVFYEGKQYTNEQIQAIYDEVFAGWGINYNPRPGASGKDDARGVIDGTYGLPEHVMKVDFAKTTKGSTVIGATNWFIAGREKAGQYWVDGPAAYDGYYTADMNDYEIRYTYYLYLPAGEEATLFDGFGIPEEFDADQLAMFNNLKIDVEGAAIQADNIPVDAKYVGDPDGKAKTAFEILKGYEVAETVIVNTDEELAEALKADKQDINITLGASVSCDVAPWARLGMGGDSTKTITINGNGNTLTFNQTDSDWNHITTKNDAALILQNVVITNSGHNDGPWNRHDLNFDCAVSLNNVVSDKALALKNDASLNNVTINDANTSDTYAIWIQPNGQSVTIENTKIDMAACTDGRGIKIDEQYVSSPKTVNLTVRNTEFITEEKSAIIVKSVAGANITLDNVDISKVAADSTNPVWVDEASAAYADKVVVTGGSCIVEP